MKTCCYIVKKGIKTNALVKDSSSNLLDRYLNFMYNANMWNN